MQPEVPVPMRSQVGDFLAAHGGIVHSADVGPLIGYAAWLIECRAIDEQVPAGWHEALTILSSYLPTSDVNGPVMAWTYPENGLYWLNV